MGYKMYIFCYDRRGNCTMNYTNTECNGQFFKWLNHPIDLIFGLMIPIKIRYNIMVEASLQSSPKMSVCPKIAEFCI